MTKQKIIVSGIAVALVIAAIGIMAYIKKGTDADPADTASRSPAAQASEPAAQASEQRTGSGGNDLAGGALLLTEPFDLSTFRSSGLPVIIDFGADSCIPCKEMAPVLVELHKELEGRAIIRFVDVWKYRDLANGIPLQVIPTQVFFDSKGKPFTPSEKLQIPMNQYATRDTNEHVFTTHEGGITKDQMLAALYEMGMKK